MFHACVGPQPLWPVGPPEAWGFDEAVLGGVVVYQLTRTVEVQVGIPGSNYRNEYNIQTCKRIVLSISFLLSNITQAYSRELLTFFKENNSWFFPLNPNIQCVSLDSTSAIIYPEI